MARLVNIKRQFLTAAEVAEFPFWAWDDSNEYLCPLGEQRPDLSAYDPPVLAGAHIWNDDFSLPGYVIGWPDHYALGVFVGGAEVIVNKNLPNDVPAHATAIGRLLNKVSLRLLPAHFEYRAPIAGGEIVRGTIRL